MRLKVWPHLSGGSGLHWVPGSPGHGGTVTGIQLHIETRLSPVKSRQPKPCSAHLSSVLALAPRSPLLPPKSSVLLPVYAHLSASCSTDSSLLPLQYQYLRPMSKCIPCPSLMPTYFYSNPQPCVHPPAHAHLSQCLGTAGCGSRCPSPHPQCSSTLAMSHSVPGCCHMHLEPLCRSSTPGARCPQGPA